MLIAICHSQPGRCCSVRLGDYSVPFSSDAQAEAFVRVLRQRIAARHRLPAVVEPTSPLGAPGSNYVARRHALRA
jgi:hypothetical protein